MRDAGIVTPQDFPHGLRCIRCEHLMRNGTAYCSVELDADVNEIVCVACAVTP